MSEKLSDYRGPVSKCIMCLPTVNIHRVFCQTCFNRGYVALCLNCDGKGFMRVPVSGSIGDMDSTCTKCGGKGTFPASKREYDDTHPIEEPVVEKEGVDLFPEISNSEKQRLIVPEITMGL